MNLGDVMTKLGRGVLTRAETEFIRLELSRLQTAADTVAGWQAGSTPMRVSTLNAQNGNFSVLPLKTIYLYKTSAQTISSLTMTDMTFAGASESGGYFTLESTGLTKIQMNTQGVFDRIALIGGNVTWEAGTAATARKVYLCAYNSSDSQVGDPITLSDVYSNNQTVTCTFNTVFPQSGNSWEGTSYLKVRVYHDNYGDVWGGTPDDLDVTSATVYITLIK